MKGYLDYTSEELDELYAKLSETAQDFVYSDIITEEVSTIGKQTGLAIDLWGDLNTLVLETVLGIVPSSMFAVEAGRRLGLSQEKVAKVVEHMDREIFSVIRDESIGNYGEENESAENKFNVTEPQTAIYDTSIEKVAADPYRETAGVGTSGATPITQEKLNLVDELFSNHKDVERQVLEQRTQKEPSSVTAPAPHEVVITKETIARMDEASRIQVTEQKPIEAMGVAAPVEGAPNYTESSVSITEVKKESRADVLYTVSPGSMPGTIKITFSKKQASAVTEPIPQTAITSAAATKQIEIRTNTTTSSAASASSDPYRELI